MQKLALYIIRFYQLIVSPMTVSHCRFYPSCSEYARLAIDTHGTTRGGWLIIKRVCKCHPLHPGGVDLVPSHSDSNATHLRNPLDENRYSAQQLVEDGLNG